MADRNQSYYCPKCRKTLKGDNFYTSNNHEKYPDGGRMPECKQCMTMFVDNWNPDTFLPILEELDIPYIPKEWNTLLVKYGKDPLKVTGTTILGRYISKMKLNQYKEYRWADNEIIRKKEEMEIRTAMKRQNFSAAEIDLVIEQGRVEMPEKPEIPEEEVEDEEVLRQEHEAGAEEAQEG